MPVLFRSGSLVVSFWSNEGNPLEPVHVHISHSSNRAASDKYWLSKDGYFTPAKGNKFISATVAQKMLDTYTAQGGIDKVVNEWLSKFGSICYFDE